MHKAPGSAGTDRSCGESRQARFAHAAAAARRLTAAFRLLMLLLMFCGGGFWAAAATAEPAVLELGDQAQVNLHPYLAYTRTSRDAGFAQLEHGSPVWSLASNRDDLNFGYTPEAVWLKLRVRSSSDEPASWRLHFGYSSLDRLELHEGTAPPRLSGDTVKLTQRDTRTRDPVFQLRLAPGEERTLYIRAISDGSLTLNSQIWSATAFADFNEASTSLITLYLGMLLALAAYNLLLLTVLRERAYLLYVCFAISFGLGALAFTGMGARYVWPEAGEWGNRLLPFALCLSGTIGTLFVRHFLNTAVWLPRWDRVAHVVAWSCMLLTLSSLVLPVRWVIPAMSLIGLAGALVMMGCLVQAARLRIPGARIFLLAWCVLISGVVLLALRNFGLLPSNMLTTYAMYLGSALELLLLSFALAARLDTLKEQTQQAQQRALAVQGELVETLRQHELELEARVSERTAELAEANARLESMAMQDPLTGLANRNALERHLDHALRRTQRRNEYLAAMLVDLDGFKQINDQLGHETGDTVLRCIGERLRALGRDADFIARLGGDEFVLIAEGITGREQAHYIAERFLDGLSLPIEIEGHSISVGASIGVALTRSAEPDMALLLRQADMAMYTRKRSGRHGVSFFSEAVA
ncbi:diguanylate cyclase [Halopseudomonas nanhaiensis]|uniref:sensor domain-containing diguanylate cyclase n=1 Tax=Halopseudomonas nanhaiensis TaxID=2830842 RepID=UPI001CBF34BD|nr:7TM diverse intracellular signaling domain-containing protein [Halopseudomonas nanhaiensis]UAW98805.1 diguanylate cyclase [Halopseudomonas nanhaiensis]